jgi:hypothetical protein
MTIRKNTGMQKMSNTRFSSILHDGKEPLKHNSDLHLCLEGGAIIFDPQPEKWDKVSGGKEGCV